MEFPACKNIGEPDKRHFFFQIMFPDNLSRSRIPPAFKKHIENEKTKQARLRTPLGTWDIGLLQDDTGDLYFARGWSKFVKDNSLGDMEFLLFKYNGSMCFDVLIFEKSTGCSRKYVPSISNQEPAAASNTFPHFTCCLESYNIGRNSKLAIPKAFSDGHLRLCKQPKKMILKNSEGTCWSVTVKTHSRYEYACIFAGWKAFADANELKQGDNYTFELVDQHTFHVRLVN